MKRRLADLLTSLALRLYPDGRYLDLDSPDPMTPAEWAEYKGARDDVN